VMTVRMVRRIHNELDEQMEGSMLSSSTKGGSERHSAVTGNKAGPHADSILRVLRRKDQAAVLNKR